MTDCAAVEKQPHPCEFSALFTSVAQSRPCNLIEPRRAAMSKTVAKAVAVVLMMSFVAACASKPAPTPAPVVRKG